MTTVTTDLEQEKRRAWGEYAESVRGLEGPEYEAAEQEAWARLQEALRAAGEGEVPLAEPPVG